MTTNTRIVSWNLRCATAGSAAWDYLIEADPDIALLQEVGSIPKRVLTTYSETSRVPVYKNDRSQRFKTVILTKGELGPEIRLMGGAEWIDTELSRFSGNLLGHSVRLGSGIIDAVSVYSPAWPIDRARLSAHPVDDIKLSLNRDLWVADLLWAAMRHGGIDSARWTVVAGDFNMSETFDSWKGGPRGNREYLDRMSDLGLIECLRHSQGALTPTFRNTDRKTVKHQMDHMFVTRALADRLIRCEVGSPSVVFEGNLSDHLPIIADFRQ